MQNHTEKKVKEIRCDNGREYLNKDFYELAKREGIYIRPSPPYTHELNGVAERYNRTIMNRARCLLAEGMLDKSYWPECVYTAAYLGNRLLTNTSIRKTPYEIFFKKRPDVTNLHLYGSKAYIRIPEECRTSKLNSKAVKGILIGYTDTGYKILVNGKVIISRHVKFIEEDERCIEINDESSNTENEEIIDEERIEVADEVDEEVVIEEVTNTNRPKRDIKLPKKYNDYVVYVNCSNAKVPESYEEAINSAESQKWEEAMKQELKSLEVNKTWTLVDEPMDKNVIEVKWIYRIKSDGK
ncbi:hypothetical protein QE152_g35275 [Popillia japonica]|uniref:Integrase catalytic domain-containing protein n=1 Tax=Popillia japonica TaxID=7064 RepID=A0AAW1IF99_POPJA